jgi:pimeloyl-ACP methyl ester carboxylesterase
MRPGYLLLALLLLLAGCHGSVQAAKQAAPAEVTDGLLDIGGLSLHIHCAGRGAPPVVMDAGLGNDGSVWKGVQGQVARTTRACVYDRAGMGYSGPAPTPHTNRQMARELYGLLTRAGLEGPYVLVGHSMGGLNVRLFEAEHPDKVVGMLLVDSSVDPLRYWSVMPEVELKKFREMLPKVGEGVDFESFAAGAADVRASSRSLGGKPLVVLTRSVQDGEPGASPEQLAELLRTWQQQQASLVGLSSNAVQIVVRNSHHYIQLDAPQLVTAAIEEVVRAARTRRRLNQAVLEALNHQGQ